MIARVRRQTVFDPNAEERRCIERAYFLLENRIGHEGMLDKHIRKIQRDVLKGGFFSKLAAKGMVLEDYIFGYENKDLPIHKISADSPHHKIFVVLAGAYHAKHSSLSEEELNIIVKGLAHYRAAMNAMKISQTNS
jgi:hypothetical protein